MPDPTDVQRLARKLLDDANGDQVVGLVTITLLKDGTIATAHVGSFPLEVLLGQLEFLKLNVATRVFTQQHQARRIEVPHIVPPSLKG